MKRKLLPKLGLILFGLLLGLFFIELLSTTIIFFYQTKQEFVNTKSFKAKHDITILALGESTTQEGGSNAWPAQLERILNEKKLGHSFSVINQGKSGITTEGILSRLKYNLHKYHPDIVISMMGINDVRAGAQIFNKVELNSSQEVNTSGSKPIWENLHIFKLIRYILSSIVLTAQAYDNSNLPQSAREFLNIEQYEQVENIINQLPKQLQTKEQYLLMYEFYLATHNFKAAFVLSKQALEIWPEKTTEYGIYLKLADAYQHAGGDYTPVLKIYDQALKIQLSSPHIYARLGWLYRDTFKDYRKVILFFQKATELDRSFKDELIMYLGYTGQFEQAYKRLDIRSYFKTLDRHNIIQAR